MSNQPLTAEKNTLSTGIKIPAHIISFIFHPLFIATYVMAFLAYVHPYAFIGVPENMKLFKVVLFVFFNTAFLPLFAVFLMRQLKLIDSMFLTTQKERIIPYTATMIFYFWAWYVSHNQPEFPEYAVNFLLGTFLAVCASWMWNIYTKISMHATAMGGLVVFFLMQSFTGYEFTGYYFSIAVIVAGLVCTSRLIVSSHTQGEIYLGFFTGALCQVVALLV
jgi:hypothetical protein